MKKILITGLLMLGIIQSQANNMPELRDILKIMESHNDPNQIGDNGKSWGILQIQLNVIKDVNKAYGTQYIHSDAFDEGCAEEIFELYLAIWVGKLEKRHNRKATIEDMVRIWNGGPRGYQRSSTLDYLKKYYKYKTLYSMNNRVCFVRGKLGIVTATYTHTYDVFLFKTRKTMNVNKKFTNLVPKEPKVNTGQLKLGL